MLKEIGLWKIVRTGISLTKFLVGRNRYVYFYKITIEYFLNRLETYYIPTEFSFNVYLILILACLILYETIKQVSEIQKKYQVLMYVGTIILIHDGKQFMPVVK